MRIVSLCPSITESLVALGLAEQLVGVTRFCVHPSEVTARIRKVGGTKDPDLDAIRFLRPDLVFANAEENRRADVEELGRELSVDVSHPRRVADVPPLVRRWGRLTGTEETAEGVSSKVQEGLGRLESDLASRPAFRCAYLVWKNPWMAAGPRTYVADLLRLAGGTLPLEESSSVISPDYPVVSEDEIVSSRPEVLILPDEPFRFREADAAYWRDRLPASSRVILVPGNDWCWHGVRTLRGLAAAEALAATAHTEAGGVGT